MTIDNLSTLATIIGGKAWGADKAKPRIYFNSCRDRKVFFEFPDFDGTHLGGARLCVFIDDCGQSANWYTSQRQIENRRRWAASLAIQAADYDLAKAEAIVDLDIDENDLNEASRHFNNDRAAEAFTLLGI